ncbi:MAG TPA: 1-(5-phosphoribosyl)-5-[(5-phosphoribosylamino)methylideneamino]imidazole-4-carboxamide isomerase [Paludibacteraceae bacterium]|nr:1-(5-phosphoribosyl)-5-[(5-phosphoribosylamino)methylideneamino]imidazole-4-carboxamide isomerase [Paludibacteraceae bacterium]MDS1031954.1 1-(5-phosphoribosyl)-5-[(5-phosphoribosylamino)methylideneamino]imidazole-4-carboxamide isomerase [Porphyromonadaceae sp. NP-X]HOH56012.1 1-(5-phosphoribosyl)-5-[(5-phosphoribosylamino)methylideneamino]imidazole-4-carboxamide isomerase [Paludibacteraceae bacterium]
MMEIIPAIDIIDGKCVRLAQGDYDKVKVYSRNPEEVAKMFADEGFRRLHLVDLDGAKAQHIVNYKVLEKITSTTDLIVDFGGGLKSDDDLRIAFESGASMVTGGSIAVKNPEILIKWLKKYSGEKIILGADAKNDKIAVSGWTESTELDLIPFIKEYVSKGIKYVICTEISRDGMLQGPAVELYKKIIAAEPQVHLIASGGVGSLQDIEMLNEAGIPSVIVGKAIYEGHISLKELSRYLS